MLSTLVIVALQCLRKVLVFFWPTDCISLDFFQGVGRSWPFLSFWPIIFFFFFPWAVIRDILISSSWRFFFSFLLVPWMLVDIRLVNIYIYIYIYICMYIVIYGQAISLYHNCSVWLDTLDASSWNGNPADFMSVRYLNPKKKSSHIFFTFTLSTTWRAQFLRRAFAF